MSGLRVESEFEVKSLGCQKFNDPIVQLGVILFPSDKVNENFLLKIRECVFNLSTNHILKKWIDTLSIPQKDKETEIEKKLYLIFSRSEPDRAVTDFDDFKKNTRDKNRLMISEIISQLGQFTLVEKFLKSFLYWELGNTAKSNRFLLDIIQIPPFEHWSNSTLAPRFVLKFCQENLSNMLKKMLSKQEDYFPLHLFILYLKKYLNDPALLEVINSLDIPSEDVILEKNHSSSWSFFNYLRIGEKGNKKLKINEDFFIKKKIKPESFLIWNLPFSAHFSSLNRSHLIKNALDKIDDKLQLFYLLENQHLLNYYSQQYGFSLFSRHRVYLNSLLSEKKKFMPTLYKLIEYGDFNEDVLLKTISFLKE